MALRVFTAQFGYKGEERIDTTVKTGENWLAPTWEIVMGHKNGKITDEQYTEQYLAMLNHSMNTHPDRWIGLLRRRKVVLVCYCGTANCFCHRYVLALVLEKLGADYKGEINNRTDVLIPRPRFLGKVINEATQNMIREYEFKKNSAPSTSSSRKMIVDPLTINAMQSQTCRDCRDNREARAWLAGKTTTFSMVPNVGEVLPLATDNPRLPNWEEDLNSKKISCCSNKVEEGEVVYQCPIFSKLVEGYFAGVTSAGTNINPCKHCLEHVDNGGRCFGDRCPDGTFDIKPGAGLVKS